MTQEFKLSEVSRMSIDTLLSAADSEPAFIIQRKQGSSAVILAKFKIDKADEYDAESVIPRYKLKRESSTMLREMEIGDKIHIGAFNTNVTLDTDRQVYSIERVEA